jgi:hypothetical protein
MFVGSTIINRPFENNGNSWNNNIRVDLKANVNEIGSGACLKAEFDISYRLKLQEC